MNKMKRIFSLVLALVMVLGAFGNVVPAFAETVDAEVTTEELTKVPADVIGTDYEAAVRRLVAFGLIEGYPDGTYQPEKEINRAQFAKLLVVALGLDDAVRAAEGQSTGFSDVKGDYWAAGYINVASGQGLLKGYPDGTFRPAQKVTYAHALTMLVRALGYQDEFLAGNWPGNYVAKAADVGITRGLRLPAASTEGSKRGIVAQLINNTLDSKIVEIKKYVGISGIEYEETGATLLKSKLDISKHEDTRIYADKIVDDGLRKDEVRVRFLQETREPKEVRVSYGENKTKDFRTKVNVRPFIGEEVTTYLTDRDEVIYIERENDDKAEFDYVEENKKTDRVSLVKFDKDYEFDKDADVYVFDSSDDEFKSVSVKDIDATKMLGKVGKFVVRNNKVVYAEVYDSTEATPWMVVMENDKDVLKGINKDTEDFKLDLTKGRNYDEVLVFDTEGNELAVKDIEKGNLVYAQLQDYDGDDVAVVTVVRDNKITGEVGKFRLDRVEIGSKTYKAMRYKEDGDNKFQAYYSVDGFEDIKDWDNGDLEDDFDDAYKKEVTAYLDATGKIAFLTTDVDSVSGYKFGIITRMYADGDRVRLFTTIDGKEGKDQIFKADKEDNLTSPLVLDKDDLVKGTKKTFAKEDLVGRAVKFKLNKDGEITKDEFYVMDYGAVQTMKGDFGKDTMDMNLGRYAVNNSVSIIDAPKVEAKTYNRLNLDGATGAGGKEIDVDDFAIAKWEDMKEDKKSDDIRVYVFPKKNRTNEVDGMVFIGEKGANTGSDEVAVYVIKKDRKADDIIVEYAEYGKGKETKIVDNATNLSDVVTQKAYVAKHKSNGKIELVNLKDVKAKALDKDTASYIEDHEDFKVYRNAFVYKTGSQFQITDKSGETFVYSGSPVTYFEDKVKDAREGDIVDLVVEKGVRVRVVGINKEGKASDKPGTGKTDGLVTYINGAETVVIIDGKTYTANTNTIVNGVNGLPLSAGDFAGLTQGDIVDIDGNTFNIKTSVTAEATAVETLISKFTGTGTQAQVTAARTAYDKLNSYGQALVTAATTNNTAKLKLGEDTLAAAAFDALVTAFTTPDATQAQVTAARTAYDALSPEAKLLVTAANKTALETEEAKLAVAEFKRLVALIPYPATLADKAIVEAARTEYGRLTPALIASVATEYGKLQTAEGQILALENALKDVEKAMGKLVLNITKADEAAPEITAALSEAVAGVNITMTVVTDPVPTGVVLASPKVTVTRQAEEVKFTVKVELEKAGLKDSKTFEITVPVNLVSPIVK